eukprot:5693582-Amphidinium_carterae.1
MSHGHRINPHAKSDKTNLEALEEGRVFELACKEYVEHMERHRDFVTSILARTMLCCARRWRDYIISEVSDKMDDHNFFVDVLQKHLKSALHLILRMGWLVEYSQQLALSLGSTIFVARKFDLILHSQMRWFVEGSIGQWVDFIRSFEPTPTQSLPPPLIKVKLIAQDSSIVRQKDGHGIVLKTDARVGGYSENTAVAHGHSTRMPPSC